MPSRRTFFATAASGLAWLMGVKAETPEPKVAAFMHERDIHKEVPVLMHQTLSDGSEKWWTEFRVITLNEWRSKPCES